MTSHNQIRNNQITTDDLAFSAYLKLKGHRLIKSDQRAPKVIFTFEIEGDPEQLKVDFVNSEFLQFYNELRNLKKMVLAN
jgi:hypothetical protein